MLVDDEGTVVWQADIAPFGGADIAINDVDNFLYETPPPK
jgi:hypothetical protein